MALTAGIDTWSVGWYLRDTRNGSDAMRSIATARAGRFDLVPDPVAGHRVLFDRINHLVMAEGHPDPDGLCSVDSDRLLGVQEAVADELVDQGVDVPRDPMRFDRPGSPGAAGIRRVDLTVDVQHEAHVGRALLSGIAAVEPPYRLRSNVHRSQVGRSIETVTWEGVKGKVARAYDKGVEAATHAPGERIRLEDQRRLPRGARVGAEQFSPGFARSMFQRRFDPLQKATKGVTVTTAAGAVRKVAEAVDAGEITPASGLKVIGYLLADREGVHLGSRMTRYRHRKCANELGLVLADGVLDEVEVPLHDLVDEVMEAEWSG